MTQSSQVVEFRPDGTVLETWKTPEVLGLHPRDASLFAGGSSLGQRAQLAPRAGAILLRTETCRAVLTADSAVLFPERHARVTLQVASRVRAALAARGGLPFELKVLEVLLGESVWALEGKGRRLRVVAEAVLEDINANFTNSSGELQRLLPIQRKLTELKQDVKELLGAIAGVADDDAALRRMCLTDRARALAAKVGGSGSGTGNGDSSSSRSNGDSASDNRTHPGTGAPAVARGASPAASAAHGFAAAATAAASNSAAATGGVKMSGVGSGATSGGSNSSTTTSGSTTSSPSSSGMHSSGHASASAPHGRAHWARHTRPDDEGRQRGMGAGSSPALTGTRPPAMRMAASILEAYEFKLDGTYADLLELEAQMDQTQTVWHMQLDHQRNRVLRVNLLMSIASFAAMTMTVPAAFFGMNLENGLEASPGMFTFMVHMSVISGLGIGGLVYAYYKFGPKRRYQARLRDMRSLRDLLMFHIDDMDSITQELRSRGSVTKSEFTNIVRGAVQGKPMSTDEVNLLYRVYDCHSPSFLHLSEMVKQEDADLDDFQQRYFD